MKKIKDLVVHKPNELIEITGNPISVLGLLTYNLLLHKFQKENTDRLIISGNEIFESLQISDNYDELYGYLDSLLNIKVISKDKKGKLWGAFHLLSEYKKIESGIFIQIPDSIFKALCNSENEKKLYYTTIKLLEQRVYKCSYTIIFYELFKKYEKVNIPIFLLKDLKELTGTSSKYTNYYDFKRYVIFKALKELNQFDKVYEYSFKEELAGKTVQKIQFSKVEKNVIDLIDNELSEKLVNAILKARKNRFVDLAYSQKAMDKIIAKYDEKDIIKGLNELYKYNSEIKNFSKILISKIDDIKKSKIEVIKTKVKAPIKDEIEVVENVQSDLDLEKEKLSIIIMQNGSPMSQRVSLFTRLSEIETIEELEKFKIEIK